MKKIGILTFHASHNNGSMLQVLALQKILEQKYRCTVEIINFSNREQKNMYASLPKADNYRRVIKNLIWLTNFSQLKKQYKSYNAFSERYLHKSQKTYATSEELRKGANKYDAFIVGSDQVWNIACRDADDAYYLNFTDNTSKYAYAVSFGANNPFEQDGKSTTHKDLVNHFKMISVRENNAQKWIKEALNKEVPLCLDPTMLLNKDEWEDVVDVGERIIKEKYIYYYCFSITSEVQKFLKWVSNKTKMPVYYIDSKEWTIKTCWKNGIKLIKEYGPDVYMNVVKNCDIFITTSFHGTAFATIYNKNFWYIDSGHNNPKKDDRAISFLTQLDLMNRYKTIQELMQENLEEMPDYNKTKQQLQKLLDKSLQYIDELVKDINNE